MFTLVQSASCGEKRENETIITRPLIGGQAHRNANSFYKAIISRQFLLHLALTLV